MINRPEYLTLTDLLQKRFFEIPDYQRTYSWTIEEREALLKDIEKIYNSTDNERHHFMSTVVCLKHSKDTQFVGTVKYEKFEVVDGQQRLTTLIILLKAISLKLHKSINAEKEEQEEIERLLVKKDKRLILLQTNNDDQDIFRNYLENGKKPEKNNIRTFTDKNMFDAFKQCEAFAEKWSKKKKLFDLLTLIKNRLGFIFYTLEDSGTVYTIFEVLNSRGLDVDWLDKAKSILMGIVYEEFGKQAAQTHIKELHKHWSRIYQSIGLTDIPGQEILRIAATLMNEEIGRKPLSAEESLKYFTEICHEDKTKVFNVVKFIVDVTIRLSKIYTNRRQKAVTEILQARLLAVAIQLSHFDKEDKDNLLNQWERVTFRIFGLYRKDSRTAVGDYVEIAKMVRNKKNTYRKIHNKLVGLGKEYPIKKIKDELFEKDCYEEWKEELRYFFFRYEEYLAKRKKAPISEEIWKSIWNEKLDKSIEHIYPQNPKESDGSWKGKLGKNITQIKKNIHRLGNLMILPPGINSRCSNKSFERKKKIYKEQLLRLKDEIVSLRDWKRVNVIKRERELIKWAEKTWCDR